MRAKISQLFQPLIYLLLLFGDEPHLEVLSGLEVKSTVVFRLLKYLVLAAHLHFDIDGGIKFSYSVGNNTFVNLFMSRPRDKFFG